jgi:hypothetical protein
MYFTVCATLQAWIAAESQRCRALRSLRIIQVGSRLEKNSQLGLNNARHLEIEAVTCDTSNCRVTSGQAYSDSKRALLLYTAHMSALHAGQFPSIIYTQMVVVAVSF